MSLWNCRLSAWCTQFCMPLWLISELISDSSKQTARTDFRRFIWTSKRKINKWTQEGGLIFWRFQTNGAIETDIINYDKAQPVYRNGVRSCLPYWRSRWSFENPAVNAGKLKRNFWISKYIKKSKLTRRTTRVSHRLTIRSRAQWAASKSLSLLKFES